MSAGAAAGAAAVDDPNSGLTIDGSVPLVPLVLLLPKPKPADDGALPAAPAGDDARAAKPLLLAPLPKTGACEPEPNTGAVFSCSVALGASNLEGGLPKVALPVEPNEKPPLVVVGADPKEGAAPLPPRVLGLPNAKPPTAVAELLVLAEADDNVIEAKGFLGAARDIGGKALDDDEELADGLALAPVPVSLPVAFAVEVPVAGAAAGDDDEGDEANGFLGAARDIGGKTADFAEDDVDAAGAGAVEASFLPTSLPLAADVASAGLAPNEKPPPPIPAAGADPDPDPDPDAVGAAVAAGASNAKPPPDDDDDDDEPNTGAGAGAGAGAVAELPASAAPLKLKPPAPIDEEAAAAVLVLAPPPTKEKPPAPMPDPDAAEAEAEARRLGGSGYHAHTREDGLETYMPFATHLEYEQAVEGMSGADPVEAEFITDMKEQLRERMKQLITSSYSVNSL